MLDFASEGRKEIVGVGLNRSDFRVAIETGRVCRHQGRKPGTYFNDLFGLETPNHTMVDAGVVADEFQPAPGKSVISLEIALELPIFLGITREDLTE